MDSSEWLRIALAMALMIVGFILLPAFFLWKDKREDERAAAAERLEAHHSYSETGPTR